MIWGILYFVLVFLIFVGTLLFGKWMCAALACLLGDKEILHTIGNPCEEEKYVYPDNRLWHQDLKWYD